MHPIDFYRSLLHAIAAAPVPVEWAATAIPPVGLLLLWDDRQEAASPILEAVAAGVGEVLTVTSIEQGPRRRPMLGVFVRPPRGDDLDGAAARLRTVYAIATAAADKAIRSGAGCFHASHDGSCCGAAQKHERYQRSPTARRRTSRQ